MTNQGARGASVIEESSLRQYRFSTFQEVARSAVGRPLVLWGGGNIAAKTLRKLSRPIDLLIDNNPNLDGTEQLGTTVRNPAALGALAGRPYILICTTSFIEVSEQLAGLGYQPERDFLVSPILNDLRIIAELESLETRLLFTSGLPPIDDPRYGGGLYELELKGDAWTYRKVLSGNCHGLVEFGEHFLVVDDEQGLLELDRDYRVVRAAELPKGVRAHGVSHSPERGCFYVTCSYADKVIELDADFRPAREFHLSPRHARDGEPHHHCNDCLVVGDSLYVSMFSLTGSWKRDVFDGVVLEFDLVTGEKLAPVISDLWMPHNVALIDGSLTVLDSLRGRLLKSNAQSIGEFPGFSRGLAHDGSYFYVGQSRNRNYSRYLGLSKNISIDTAIIVFDEYTKVSRSLQLPPRLSEIHSLLAL
jgi:hypothetical protein